MADRSGEPPKNRHRTGNELSANNRQHNGFQRHTVDQYASARKVHFWKWCTWLWPLIHKAEKRKLWQYSTVLGSAYVS